MTTDVPGWSWLIVMDVPQCQMPMSLLMGSPLLRQMLLLLLMSLLLPHDDVLVCRCCSSWWCHDAWCRWILQPLVAQVARCIKELQISCMLKLMKPVAQALPDVRVLYLEMTEAMCAWCGELMRLKSMMWLLWKDASFKKLSVDVEPPWMMLLR